MSAPRLTEKELDALDESSSYGEVSGAYLATAVVEAKRARASESALLEALELAAFALAAHRTSEDPTLAAIHGAIAKAKGG